MAIANPFSKNYDWSKTLAGKIGSGISSAFSAIGNIGAASRQRYAEGNERIFGPKAPAQPAKPSQPLSVGLGMPAPYSSKPATPTFSTPVKPQVKATVAPTPAPVVPSYAPPVMPSINMNVGPEAKIPAPTGSTGGGSAPSAPVRPTVNPETQAAVTNAEKLYQKSMEISPEELSTQEDLDKLIQSTREAYLNESGKPMPMEFITGHLKSIEQRALGLAEPLESKLARMQSARTASLEASKFALERADKRLASEQSAVEKATELKSGSSFYDPTTGEWISAPSKQEGFTLSPGQSRFDADGNIIASGGAEEDATMNELLSPSEAQSLGVPYGTTKGEAAAMGITKDATPTAEQSKARQFAVSADNANKILGSSTYKLGAIENPWMPNALKSEDRQMFEQASRAFVNSVLRRESGATITDDEFQNKYRELIPQAGDSDGVIAQKKAARDAAVQSIIEAGGSGGGTSGGGRIIEYNGKRYQVDAQGNFDPNSPLTKAGNASDSNVQVKGWTSSNIGKLKQSIITQESGGNYSSIGLSTPHGKALGKYQIIPKFHFAKIGLNPNSPSDQQKFLRSPALQDQLFGQVIDELARTYNNDPRKIAAAYYGGDKGASVVGTKAGSIPQTAGGKRMPSINQYVNSVISRIT